MFMVQTVLTVGKSSGNSPNQNNNQNTLEI